MTETTTSLTRAGQTAEEYATNLEQNLLSLIDRIKFGRYQAPPVRKALYRPRAMADSAASAYRASRTR